MDIPFALAVLGAVAVGFTVLSERYSQSAPLVLILVGIVCAYVPGVPDLELTPEIVLLGLLPPLLYSTALRTSLIDIKANKRPIAVLSVGMVLLTAVAVGLLLWWVIDVPFWAALALGAVVAPPDAVAASAIARQVGLPRRIVTILEGESLMNDATAIVALRTAIAAGAGSVAAWEVGAGFVVSAVGGFAVGAVVALLVGRIRARIHAVVPDVAFSLLTPWLAYLTAEEVHVPGVEQHPSGVLAVVTAGLIIGHQTTLFQSGASRLFETTNWTTISWVLEHGVFLLIGLQMRDILDGVGDSTLSTSLIVTACVGTLVTVVVVRIVGVFGTALLPRLLFGRTDTVIREPSGLFIVGWAGMRGVVTLAGAFLLPEDTPHREVLVLIAFVVTIGTLMLQGLTLPWLVRRLGIRGPDRHEDHLQEATVLQAVSDAGLLLLDEEVAAGVDPEVVDRLRTRVADRTNAVWERLGGIDPPSVQYNRVRAEMIAAERAELVRIRGEGLVDQSVLLRVMNALDLEETLLARAFDAETTADRETELRPTYDPEGACEHLAAACTVPQPLTPTGCAECLADGATWVHLRLCMTCGHVGCCDSSPGRHATAHFHETGHPVIRSFEPGEAWRWCYVDEATG